jgi:hypothetical protein
MATAYALSRHQISVAQAENYLRDLIYVGNADSVDVTAMMETNVTVYTTRNADQSSVFSISSWITAILPDGLPAGYLAKASMLAEPV